MTFEERMREASRTTAGKGYVYTGKKYREPHPDFHPKPSLRQALFDIQWKFERRMDRRMFIAGVQLNNILLRG